ncbi:helical backbone metal receptor [bacterium]|nr:helical backbone metal receptor [bacterium]
MLIVLCLCSRVVSLDTSVAETDQLERIISMAPNLTEIVFALGQGNKIIGVTDFDHWPAAVNSLVRVGGYYNPNKEVIIQLKPDAVFMLRGRSALDKNLIKLGIKTRQFTCENINDIKNTIIEIGKILEVEVQAIKLRDNIEIEMRNIKIKKADDISVMICVGMTPGTLQNLFVAGNKSMHHDLLEFIGCKNTFAHISKSYFPVNKEALLAARPDIIIDLIPGQRLDKRSRRERLETWGLLSGVPAVKTGKIIILNEDFCNIPGPRIIQTGRLISDNIRQLIANEN